MHDLKSLILLHLCPDQTHPDCPDFNNFSRFLNYDPPASRIVAKVLAPQASAAQGVLSSSAANHIRSPPTIFQPQWLPQPTCEAIVPGTCVCLVPQVEAAVKRWHQARRQDWRRTLAAPTSEHSAAETGHRHHGRGSAATSRRWACLHGICSPGW